MLEVENLGVNYRGVCALDNISFAVVPGQIVGILGPNGAGKTTLLKAMLGLVPITRGKVQLNHCPLKQQLQQVAYVPQRSQIDWDFPITVYHVVMMARTVRAGWFRSPSRQSKELVRVALERVGMWEHRHRQIGELSGGQQQRVFLARAIAQQAELFLFDEPFNAIDKSAQDIIFDVFRELKSQAKILLVISHDLGETLNYYDRLLLLKGQLIAMGSRTEVLTAANVQQAYGHDFRLLAA